MNVETIHGTATYVRDLKGWKGDVKLWQVEPPVRYGSEKPQREAEYVVTSAVDALFTGPETYIFPVDEEGKVLSWGELPGSYRGSFSHELAIAGLDHEKLWEEES